MKLHIFIAFKLLVVMTILIGLIYSFCVYGVAQLLFPQKANGSLITVNQRVIGSTLIGQNFDSSEIYFHSRPSISHYQSMPSMASNLSITSQLLLEKTQQRKAHFLSKNHLPPHTIVPTEMIFASGSGLDPHISLQSALLQIHRIAKARNLDSAQIGLLRQLIDTMTQNRQFGIFGDTIVNVLLLNINMDKRLNHQ